MYLTMYMGIYVYNHFQSSPPSQQRGVPETLRLDSAPWLRRSLAHSEGTAPWGPDPNLKEPFSRNDGHLVSFLQPPSFRVLAA